MRNILGGMVEVGLRTFEARRCRGCGARSENGEFLCLRCLEVILGEARAEEIFEDEKTAMLVGRVFRSAMFLGPRDGILGEMVEEYKYMARREMARVIARVVYQGYFGGYSGEKEMFMGKKIGPKGVGGVLLVPMPTARKHVRERGFDHIDLICRELEKLDGRIKIARMLRRHKDTVQVGANMEKRQRQAQEAVEVNLEEVRGWSEEGAGVVLIDDVWTTGSSLLYAGEKLRKLGVENLYGLAITKNRAGTSPVIRRYIK